VWGLWGVCVPLLLSPIISYVVADGVARSDKGLDMEAIKFDLNNEAEITVERYGNSFIVSCGDYVANEWSEDYPTLSLALARVAVLVKCGEVGFNDSGFNNKRDEFVNVAGEFLNDSVVVFA